MIVAAALHYKGLTFTVPQPGRHGDVMKAMRAAGCGKVAALEADQGFITSGGHFVGRILARKIALSMGQVLKDRLEPVERANELFSEDVW